MTFDEFHRRKFPDNNPMAQPEHVLRTRLFGDRPCFANFFGGLAVGWNGALAGSCGLERSWAAAAMGGIEPRFGVMGGTGGRSINEPQGPARQGPARETEYFGTPLTTASSGLSRDLIWKADLSDNSGGAGTSW